MDKQLTSEQIKLMYEHRDSYIDFIVNNHKYRSNRDNIKKENNIKNNIAWIYKKAGLEPPKFIFRANSYLEEKLMINYIINNGFGLIESVRDQVYHQIATQVSQQVSTQVSAQVWDQVRNQVCAQVSDQVSDQVRDQVWDQVEAQVSDQVWDQVRDQVEAQVRKQVRKQVWAQVWQQVRKQVENTGKSNKKMEFIEQHFGLPWNSWLSFYSFFDKLDIINNDDFNKYYHETMKNNGKGIWSIQFFRDWCIYTPLPRKIHRDAQNRLHSVDGSAVEWNNKNIKNYFIHGVRFESELWERVVKGTIRVDEIIRIQNQEQKAAILSTISPEKLLREVGAIEMSRHIQPKTTNKNNKPIILYVINHARQLFDTSDLVYILVYEDPSTDRKYFSFVPPEAAKDGAATAMAWKFGISKELYMNNMVKET